MQAKIREAVAEVSIKKQGEFLNASLEEELQNDWNWNINWMRELVVLMGKTEKRALKNTLEPSKRAAKALI